MAETRRTTCSRDCPDACSILATTEAGRVTALRGDPDHPVTRGFLCFRTSRFLERQNGEERLDRPLIRTPDGLRPVSMEEALDHAAIRLQRIRSESGPAAIFHYRSGGSLGILKGLADLFFERFGPCTTKVGDICSGAGEAAQEADFGVSDSNDLFDLQNSRCILLWGKNPVVSSVHLVPMLKEVRAKGTRIVLIDPVRHRSAALAGTVMQPRPGSDVELALGVAQRLFARGLVDPAAPDFCRDLDAFEKLATSRTAEEYAAAADVPVSALDFLADCLHEGPTAILVGWGMQRRRRGAATVRVLDALSALSGNLFRSGGGCSFYFKRRGPFAALARGPTVAPRTIREPMLGPDVLAAADPPIRAIWVTAGNPVSMLPDAASVARAFERTEFVVVADCFLTDTAARADLVLPVPTLLEDDDLLGAYGHHWVAESRPVVPPPDGVLPEPALFQKLAEKVGLQDFPTGTIDGLKRLLLSPSASHGLTLEELRRGATRNPRAGALLFPDGRVKTPDGRVRLMTEQPPSEAIPAPAGDDADFASPPLWLFSNSTEKSQASVWAGRGLGERTWITVHSSAVPGLREGDTVVVQGPIGTLEAELRIDDDQRPDVALMPKGGHFDRGHSANSLIPARTTDLGLGAAYLDCMVRIRRQPDRSA